MYTAEIKPEETRKNYTVRSCAFYSAYCNRHC